MGGEELPPEAHTAGAEFYNTLYELPFLKRMYTLAEKKYLIYITCLPG
jgi:hypothetical protein